MLEVTPLENEAFGAVITGVSPNTQLTDSDIEFIKDALAKHTAVVINDLEEDPDGHAFAMVKSPTSEALPSVLNENF